MRKFRQFTISEFETYISSVPVKRNIGHIQIHHTWKPRIADYRGESTILGMYNYHTKTNGWRDIGQHFSIAPDGTIWDGRDLDIIPAGIKGYNSGGLMFEIIGYFDVGQDRLDSSQLFAVTRAVIACQDRFRLKNPDIVFHRAYDTSKSCPGSGIDRHWFLKMIDQERKSLEKKVEPLPAIQRKVEGTFGGLPDGQAAYIINNMTYVPLRYFAENLGAKVDWDGKRYHVLKKE